jgi:WD40 repeat protein
MLAQLMAALDALAPDAPPSEILALAGRTPAPWGNFLRARAHLLRHDRGLALLSLALRAGDAAIEEAARRQLAAGTPPPLVPAARLSLDGQERSLKTPGAFFVLRLIAGPPGELLVGGISGEILRWSLDRGEVVRRYPISEGDVHALALSPDGTTLAISARGERRDGSVSLLSLASGRVARVPFGPSPPCAVAWSPEGELVIAPDRFIEFRSPDGQQRRSVIELEAPCYLGQLLFLDDRWLLGVGPRTVMQVDRERKSVIQHDHTGSESCSSAALLREERALLLGWGDGSVSRWDLDAGRAVWSAPMHEDFLTSVVALPGGLAASGGFDRALRIWDQATGAPRRVLWGQSESVTQIVPLGGLRLATAGHSSLVRVWDLAPPPPDAAEPARETPVARETAAHEPPVRGRTASRGAKAPTARGGQLAPGSDPHHGAPWVGLDEAGRLAVSLLRYCWDDPRHQGVRAWDVASGQVVERWKPLRKAIQGQILHPSGTLLALGLLGSGVTLFAVPGGQKMQVLAEPGKKAQPLAFLPGTTRLLSGDEKGSIYLHEATTGALLWQTRAHAMALQDALVLAGGSEVVTTAGQATSLTARRWSLQDGRALGTVVLRARYPVARLDWSHAVLDGDDPRLFADGRQTGEEGQPQVAAGLATATGHGRWLRAGGGVPVLRSLHEPAAAVPLGDARSGLVRLSVDGQRALVATEAGWCLDLWELPPAGASITAPARRLQRLAMDSPVSQLETCAAGAWAASLESGVVQFFAG